MADEQPSQHKTHRISKRGRKADKKKTRKQAKNDANITVSKKAIQQNPKAFAFSSARRAQKQAQRAQEVQQKKLHVPLVDRTPADPPPMVVAVVGPPGCGKSSLIRSLVRKYCRQTLTDIKGPITVVAGKKRRITLIECANDLNSMIDVAKIADLCLLMINAKHGFQMETFEFLNIAQTHGMPRVLGVLSHLDEFKDVQRLKDVKKRLKQRFWAELFQGAKLFYLSGILNGRLYLPMETQNLARFISVTKPKPLIWRNAHPYVLVDRIEDLTPVSETKSSNGRCDRTVCFYGWVRGTALKEGQQVHISGAGDLSVHSATILDDPCPLPKHANDRVEVVGLDGKRKRIRTRLNDKQKRVHAPMSDLSGVLFDQDAVYIDVPSSAFAASKNTTEKNADSDDSEEGAVVFESEEPLDNLDEEGEWMLGKLQKRHVTSLDAHVDNIRMPLFKQSTALKAGEFEDSFDDGDDDNSSSAKEDDVSEEELEDEFLKKRHVDTNLDRLDSYRPVIKGNLEDSSFLERMRSRFITGQKDKEADVAGSDGGFEDVDGLDDNGEEVAAQEDEKEDDRHAQQKLAVKKTELKAKFDDDFDGRFDARDGDKADDNYYEQMKASMARQQALNDAEFADELEHGQIELIGCRAGKYVRIVIRGLPCEFVEHSSPLMHTIIGGLLPSESSFGFCQTRLKKHRWFPKILKNNEPLVFSVGWRRFQSIPLFSMRDAGTRNRLVKYTPEHMHCMATFYGPIVTPGTGFVAFRSLADGQSAFRIAATGTILELDASSTIVKKLKLVGYPMRVHRNTVFIRDMFTSSLEVAKFEGAMLRSVSGIRGQIKKAIRAPDGAFRATFEDKLLLSDIVFLRAWYPVQPRTFYNPITNLLLPTPTTMRLNVELRAEAKQATSFQRDSLYREITERPTQRRFNPLVIPRSLQRALPFASKPKLDASRRDKKPTYRQQRAVMLEPHEKRALSLLQQLGTLDRQRREKRKQKHREALDKHAKKQTREQQVKEEKLRNAIKRTIAKQAKQQ